MSNLKTLLLLLIFISSLFGEAKVYVGTHYALFTESFNDIDATSSSDLLAVKIGYGDIKAYAVEFSLEYAQNKSKIFSSSPTTQTDGDKIGFNVSLLKAFDFTYLYPYVKIGFGTGYLNIQRELQDSLAYGSFEGTIGSHIPLSSSFNLEFAYEMRHNSYESINTIVTKTSYSSVSNITYFGINYRY